VDVPKDDGEDGELVSVSMASYSRSCGGEHLFGLGRHVVPDLRHDRSPVASKGPHADQTDHRQEPDRIALAVSLLAA